MRIGVSACVAVAALCWLAAVRSPAQDPEPIRPPRGTEEPAAAPAADMGYALGYRIGEQIASEHRELGTPIDQAALARGLADGAAGGKPRLDEAAFGRALAALDAAMQQKQREFAERMRAAARANLEKGARFLGENGGRPGVTTLPSGLQYEILQEGTGPRPAADHVVVARYRGMHIDGSDFDGTDPEGEPAAFPLRGVVPGWQEALPLMKAGSKWRITLPPALAYGEQGSPPAIEPNEVLVFEIELIGSRPERSGR